MESYFGLLGKRIILSPPRKNFQPFWGCACSLFSYMKNVTYHLAPNTVLNMVHPCVNEGITEL